MARRSFVDTMREVRAGQVLEELDTKLQQLVQSVQSTGGSGELVLKISVKPMKGSTEACVVTDDIKLKVPEIKNAGTVMFPTPEGNLSRKHPRQEEIPGITLASRAS